jgi:hypothetical protein
MGGSEKEQSLFNNKLLEYSPRVLLKRTERDTHFPGSIPCYPGSKSNAAQGLHRHFFASVSFESPGKNFWQIDEK